MNQELVDKMVSYNGKVHNKDFTLESVIKDFPMFDKIEIIPKGSKIYASLRSDRLVIHLDDNDKVIMVVPR